MLPVPLIRTTSIRTKLASFGQRVDSYTKWAFNPPVHDRFRDISR